MSLEGVTRLSKRARRRGLLESLPDSRVSPALLLTINLFGSFSRFLQPGQVRAILIHQVIDGTDSNVGGGKVSQM